MMNTIVYALFSSIILSISLIPGVSLDYVVEESLNLEENADNTMSKIGIIGGGIGGAATSYFLRNAFQTNALLHVYEANIVGGRLALSSNFDEAYETGGSIIHPRNHYMNSFVKTLGLQKSYGCPSKFGIFDGKEYSFLESNWSLVNLAKFFWRYGFDVYRLKTLTDSMLNSFSRIYELQNAGSSFTTVEDILQSMDADFPLLLNKSTRSYLKELGFHNLIIDELVTASTRTNYGQLSDINAFVGSVSVVGASPDLWSVVGGNKRVPEELLKYSNATLINRLVTTISLLENGKFRVGSKDLESPKEVDQDFIDYDSVVIATPLTKDASFIRFVNVAEQFDFPGQYEKIICTLVQGELNANTFKFKEINIKVEEILTNNPSLFYNSVGKQSPVDKKSCNEFTSKVYKVFSPNELTQEMLHAIFDRIGKVEVKEWRAYPHYITGEFDGRIELMPGLYYNNAIEQAASAMEMSAIAAKNSALLVEKYIKGNDALKVKEKKDEL